MIFTNHRSLRLKVSPALYQERESRLAKFIQLKAPPVVVKDAAQLLTASFRWSWRGLLSDAWLWAQYSRLGWWVHWLLSKEFRSETDAVGLEMMELLEVEEPEDSAPGEYHTDIPAPGIPPNQRRRFAESWAAWRKRVAAERGSIPKT